jgi:putative flavoprotein involved in K+ transport
VALPAKVETVVVGAGHAGLLMSWHLSRAGRDHAVLEARSKLGGGWQDRWASFRLVTPNWTSAMPGFEYDGEDPDGFMPRDEIAARMARYAEVVRAPVSLNTAVTKLSEKPLGGFRLETTAGPIEARSVIVATGSFHRPKTAPLAVDLPKRLTQIHAHHYKRESDLPPGGVLVVGTGQTGVQLAEELFAAGRRVYLSTGTATRIPRRYRGRDVFHWLVALLENGDRFGNGLPKVESLPGPMARFTAPPALSGQGGGHDTNLREFAARGIVLLGRIASVSAETLTISPDLPANLARADAFFDDRLKPIVDGYIASAGIEAPPDDRVPLAFEPEILETLDLGREGISTILWATGYRPDFGWIDLPIIDEYGLPRGAHGLTDVPGLSFLGLVWQRHLLSISMPGAVADGRYLATAMGLTSERQTV